MAARYILFVHMPSFYVYSGQARIACNIVHVFVMPYGGRKITVLLIYYEFSGMLI